MNSPREKHLTKAEQSSANKRLPKAVFFDVDGVLSDSLEQHLKFCRDMSDKLHLSVEVPSVADFRTKVARGARANPMKEFLRTVGFPADKLDQIDRVYQERFGKDYPVSKFPGIDNLLKKLAESGVPLGLVTSNVEANVKAVLGTALDHFDPKLRFFGSKKTAGLIKGVGLLSEEPADCVFVGDVPTDALAALQAGVGFVGVTYGWGILGNEKFTTVNAVDKIASAVEAPKQVPYPFDPGRAKLYTVDELWTGFDPDMNKNTSLDAEIFRYFKTKSKYNPRLEELQAQRSHDGGIEYAVDDLLGTDDTSYPTGKRPVMILGSHSKLRSDPWFARVARLTYDLARANFFVCSGGGPGLMEAANLGAYMATNYTKGELNDALDILRLSQEPAPGDARKQYEMPDYWEVAQRVVERFPNGGESLGVPTWFYGHEGANIFCRWIAKFFSNGLRESKMTSIGHFGSIFTPGGPGTSQEVFTDAAENAYHSFQWLSPMIFFNEESEPNVAKMMDVVNQQTSPDYRSQEMLLRSTNAQQIIDFLNDKPPRFRERKD